MCDSILYLYIYIYIKIKLIIYLCMFIKASIILTPMSSSLSILKLLNNSVHSEIFEQIFLTSNLNRKTYFRIVIFNFTYSKNSRNTH